MDIKESIKITENMLKEHGVTNYAVKISNTRRSIGRCIKSRKRGSVLIELSGFFWDHLSEEGALDTIKHEVAHAIAPHGAGHNRVWKAIATKLGARPDVKSGDWKFKPGARESFVAKRKYRLTCRVCNYSAGLSRMDNATKSYIDIKGVSPYRCKKCLQKGVNDNMCIMDVTQNY